MDRVFWSSTTRVPLPMQTVDTDPRPEDPMLTSATTEAFRLVSSLARRIDAELVASAARNAESGVLAAHQRLLDAMTTLDDLLALEGLPGEVADADAPPARERELATV